MKKIILILVLAPLLASAVTKKTQSLFTFHLTGGVTMALDKNRDRKALMISSLGSDAIIVQFGSSSGGATSGEAQHYDGLRIPGSSGYVWEKDAPQDQIWIRGTSSAGSRSVGIVEFE